MSFFWKMPSRQVLVFGGSGYFALLLFICAKQSCREAGGWLFEAEREENGCLSF